MNRAGLVAALAAEARTLGRAVRRPDGLSVLRDGALLAVGGMGRVRAARAARRLIDAGAQGLVSFGFAGGLDPALRAGSIVCPADIIGDNGARFATSADWRERLYAAAAQRPAAGALLCRTAPLATVADKAAAFRDTGAVAIDMESASVAEVAAAFGLPCIAVRVIVDTAADALPQAVLAASRDGELRLHRLLGGLALAPLELPALFRLAQRYRAATRSLAAIARAGLPAPRAVSARVA